MYIYTHHHQYIAMSFSGNDAGYIAVDELTGDVTVAQQLSAQLTPEIFLNVQVKDQGGLTGSCSVRIAVKQTDTSQPYFTQQVYRMDLIENTEVGSHVTRVEARSPSGGTSYSMTGTDRFRIHPSTGDVFLIAPLDYEAFGSGKAVVNCTLIAASPSGVKAYATLVVMVKNANDHPPMFNRTLYRGVIREGNQPGALVSDGTLDGGPLALVAEDRDKHDRVSFRIKDPWARRMFTIDYGTATVRVVSRLKVKDLKSENLTFEVLAFDSGSPPLVSPVPALVIVHVIDINDEPPRFTKAEYPAKITLPSLPGVQFVQIFASDPDQNSTLRYSLLDSERRFAIDAVSGWISLAKHDFWNTTDFSTKLNSVLDFRAFVSDGIHRAETLITVEISKIVPNPAGLRFATDTFHVKVKENLDTPQPVLLIPIKGSRLGEHVSFRILNTHPSFTIDAVSGYVSTTGIPLDRELEPEIDLLIEATDQNIPPNPARTLLKVVVMDDNDNAPVFVNRPYYAVVPVDAEPGDNVTRVEAIDPDIGKILIPVLFFFCKMPKKLEKFTFVLVKNCHICRI